MWDLKESEEGMEGIDAPSPASRWALRLPGGSPDPPLPCLFQELQLPTFRAHSPLLKSRRSFVDALALLSSHCQLCPAARHLAVYLLDHFLDRYDITTSKQLYTVAVSCLLLASTRNPLPPLCRALPLREPTCSQIVLHFRGPYASSVFIFS